MKLRVLYLLVWQVDIFYFWCGISNHAQEYIAEVDQDFKLIDRISPFHL